VSETVSAAPKKKICLSAIQPTGVITLGNYLGAVKNWAEMQDEYNCIFSIADLHAITVRQEPAALRKNTREMAAILLACGIDPQRSLLFIQSHVPAHSQLAWVLNCYTQFGELSRMTQFKDKSARYADNINAGLFTYPALMAADILLYQADVVPVGADQKQHLEITRDIANRMNGLYPNLFTVPEPFIPKKAARVMSLQNPDKKMSKSDPNPKGCIAILDTEDQIIKKFKSAVTDSEAQVAYREGKDGINNLMSIYSAFTGKDYAEIEKEFEGKGYGDFKLAVGQVVADQLKPIREEFNRLMKDTAYLDEVCKTGAETASRFAYRTLNKVYKKVGFLPYGGK